LDILAGRRRPTACSGRQFRESSCSSPRTPANPDHHTSPWPRPSQPKNKHIIPASRPIPPATPSQTGKPSMASEMNEPSTVEPSNAMRDLPRQTRPTQSAQCLNSRRQSSFRTIDDRLGGNPVAWFTDWSASSLGGKDW